MAEVTDTGTPVKGHWNGEIAYVVVSGEVLTEEQAQAFTATEHSAARAVLTETEAPETAGSTVGTVSVTEGTPGAPVLPAGWEDNDLFELDGTTLKVKTALTRGDYTGRVLFCVYDNFTGGERASVVYSDDGGKTWARGARTVMGIPSPGKSSEAQLVELPNGTVRMFARSSGRYIGYADSFDGEATWEPMVQDMGTPL